MLNTIKALNLYEYYDNKGYNVLEIPIKDCDNNANLCVAILVLLDEYPNLHVKVVDEFGNISDYDDKNSICIIYDPKVWELNGIE